MLTYGSHKAGPGRGCVGSERRRRGEGGAGQSCKQSSLCIEKMRVCRCECVCLCGRARFINRSFCVAAAAAARAIPVHAHIHTCSDLFSTAIPQTRAQSYCPASLRCLQKGQKLPLKVNPKKGFLYAAQKSKQTALAANAQRNHTVWHGTEVGLELIQLAVRTLSQCRQKLAWGNKLYQH